MANEPFMDRWTLNGTEVLLQDHGRDQANGVPVLNNEAKLPLSYMPQNYASWLKVSPEDPNEDSFADWLVKLNSELFRNRGKVWTQSTQTNASIRGLAYGNGLFVAGGAGSSAKGIYWSEDGMHWTQVSGMDVVVTSVAFINNLWLALTSGSGLYWSENGKTWTQAVSSGTFQFPACYNNFWVCGTSGKGVYWSEDGKTWTQSTGEGSFTSYTMQYPVYADGLWVVSSGANQGMWWSENGKEWHKGTGTMGQSSMTMGRAIKQNGIWVVGATNTKGVHWSEDGKTWNYSNLSTSASTTAESLTYANNVFVIYVVSPTHMLCISADGKTWTTISAVSNNIREIIYANGIFVAMPITGTVWYSENGTNWFACNGCSGTTSYSGCLMFANGIWIAVFNANTYISENGKNWSIASGLPSGGENLQLVCYGNGVWVRGSNGAGLWYSQSKDLWLPETE